MLLRQKQCGRRWFTVNYGEAECCLLQFLQDLQGVYHHHTVVWCRGFNQMCETKNNEYAWTAVRLGTMQYSKLSTPHSLFMGVCSEMCIMPRCSRGRWTSADRPCLSRLTLLFCSIVRKPDLLFSQLEISFHFFYVTSRGLKRRKYYCGIVQGREEKM